MPPGFRKSQAWRGLTQGLVAAAVLAGLAILARGFARSLAVLRALGAPARFVLAVVWGHAATLLAAGAGLGLALGHLAAAVLSREIARRTDIAVAAAPGWTEVQPVAGFLGVALVLALLPAWAALRRPVAEGLRA